MSDDTGYDPSGRTGRAYAVAVKAAECGIELGEPGNHDGASSVLEDNLLNSSKF